MSKKTMAESKAPTANGGADQGNYPYQWLERIFPAGWELGLFLRHAYRGIDAKMDLESLQATLEQMLEDVQELVENFEGDTPLSDLREYAGVVKCAYGLPDGWSTMQ